MVGAEFVLDDMLKVPAECSSKDVWMRALMVVFTNILKYFQNTVEPCRKYTTSELSYI